MSAESMTSHRHNDYVGSDANKGRIPGADQATTGHHFVEVFPKEDTRESQRRPDEHLPPPTGRGGIQPQPLADPDSTEIGGPTERLTTVRGPQVTQGQPQQQQQPLAPAPDSRTVIDRDPFAPRTTAADTMTGATSRDVYNGIGRPAAGMTSAEMHHDGNQHRKRGMQGTDQFGTAVLGSDDDGGV